MEVIMTQTKKRKLVFILIFESLFHDDIDEMIESCLSNGIEISAYAESVLRKITNNKEAIDKIIDDNLKGWEKDRISKVSLSTLYLSIYEMLYDKKVPKKVSINEAVELCKEFGTDEDRTFVNGMLGSIVRKKEDN
jgi:N utilization substance protein B